MRTCGLLDRLVLLHEQQERIFGRVHLNGSDSFHLCHRSSVTTRKYRIYEEDRKKRYNEIPKKSETRQIYELQSTFEPLCHIYQ